MNTYAKYVPNVWLAKSELPYEKGQIIEVANKYGKKNDHIIHNLIIEKNGFFYYSITRLDWHDDQYYAEKRAERLRGFAETAERKSDEHYKKSERDRDFLVLAEPIKIGHHSEARHRKAISYARDQFDKSMEFQKKADSYESRVAYWEAKKDKINLSMPESIEYYEHLVEKTTKIHEELKNGDKERRHAFSLTYANKAKKDAEKNLLLARKLWA